MKSNYVSSPAKRWQLLPGSDELNIVLLGAEGLSHELANEITVSNSTVSFKDTIKARCSL